MSSFLRHVYVFSSDLHHRNRLCSRKMRREGVDLKEAGIALYLVRKASKCQRENKCGCLNMFVVVESICHLVAVSGQCALSWVPCVRGSAPSQVPLLVLAEKWEGSTDSHLSASHPKVVPNELGDQLVVVPCNGRPSPQARKFYWDKQGQSGMRSWGLAQLGTWVCVSARLPALALLLGPNTLQEGLSMLCDHWD